MEGLFQLFDTESGRRIISEIPVPESISQNLKPGFGQRPYQLEAFKRFVFCRQQDFPGKPSPPLHLLYQMATGSGKTVVMGGLILYLYEQGYRNFLFFVNSTNLIQKTKDNFLRTRASKYVFAENIRIGDREVYIKEVENFEEADSRHINLKFTTIQKLYSDLQNTRENGITYEDFKGQEIVLLADEAHHLNTETQTGNLFGNWETTVQTILRQNYANILLEFTATLDQESREILAKYKDKIIYKYDLAQFRLDKYSKEISLLRSQYDEKERVLQAVLLNIYRQELAASYNLNVKPVVLFKSKQIQKSKENQAWFHRLIADLRESDLQKLMDTSSISIIQQAFSFFRRREITLKSLVSRMQQAFRPENCISANNDTDAGQVQYLLNTLEDTDNPIRGIFAVQKLNEGWDVLNLFDIVRLYEGHDGKHNRPGKTTLSEAQLIGRGARYFPFALDAQEDKFTRKYDSDLGNELRVLEELYYHTREDSRYISELKVALREMGVYEDEDKKERKKLEIKEEFKKTDLYKSGQVFYNKRIPRNYGRVKSLTDLGARKVNYRHTLSSGFGSVVPAFSDNPAEPSGTSQVNASRNVALLDIPRHVVHAALSGNPFFHFSHLRKFFPNLFSVSQFLTDSGYLGKLEITFLGTAERIRMISHADYKYALTGFFLAIQEEIQRHLTAYEGSEFIHAPFAEVFTDKEVTVYKDLSDGQEETLASESWYAYKAHYGTSEERKFVEMFASRFESLCEKFTDIYLVRNERELKIYDSQGRAFEPDFLLFCRQRGEAQSAYQVFIEPKGAHLAAYDAWKEDFLNRLRDKKQVLYIHSEKYTLTAVPFYHSENENEFWKELEETLEV